MHLKPLSAHLLPSYAAVSSAFILNFYPSKRMQGPPGDLSVACGGVLPHQVMTGAGDCSTEQFDPQNRPTCLKVISTGEVDSRLEVVWFSSDDCNPENMLGHGDHKKNAGSFDIAGYKSWQVWDVVSDDSRLTPDVLNFKATTNIYQDKVQCSVSS